MKKGIISLILTTAVLCTGSLTALAFDFKAIDPNRTGNAWDKVYREADTAPIDKVIDAVGRTSVCYNDDKDLISFDKVYDFRNETEYFDYDFTIDPALGSKAVVLEDLSGISVFYSDMENIVNEQPQGYYIAPDGYDASYATEYAENVPKGATYTLDKYGYYFFQLDANGDGDWDIYATVRIDDQKYIENIFRTLYGDHLAASYEAYLDAGVADMPDFAESVMTESKSQMLSIAGARNTLGAYNIADNNYFKLRDICCALTDMGYNIEVTWDGAKNAINLITGQPYTRVGGEYEQNDSGMQTANISSSAVYLNGTPIDITAYNINDNNFFKLRDLCRALNIYIEWDSQQQIIAVDPDRTYIEN